MYSDWAFTESEQGKIIEYCVLGWIIARDCFQLAAPVRSIIIYNEVVLTGGTLVFVLIQFLTLPFPTSLFLQFQCFSMPGYADD